jgi:hypothetical protein
MMRKWIDEDRQHVVAPNFRREHSPGLVRWCSSIENEIKIKYSALPESDLARVVAAEIERSREQGCTLEWQLYEHDQPEALCERACLVEAGLSHHDEGDALADSGVRTTSEVSISPRISVVKWRGTCRDLAVLLPTHAGCERLGAACAEPLQPSFRGARPSAHVGGERC